MGTYDYAGCLTLPRQLFVSDEGRLIQVRPRRAGRAVGLRRIQVRASPPSSELLWLGGWSVLHPHACASSSQRHGSAGRRQRQLSAPSPAPQQRARGLPGLLPCSSARRLPLS